MNGITYVAEFVALLRPPFAEVERQTQVRASSVAARQRAVAALQQLVWWRNPLRPLLRALGRSEQAWRELAGLAVATPPEFPIVVPALAPVLSDPVFWSRCARSRAAGRARVRRVLDGRRATAPATVP